MIYLPHLQFNFSKANQLNIRFCKSLVESLNSSDLRRPLSRFLISDTGGKDGCGIHKRQRFGFLREDGVEFGILHSWGATIIGGYSSLDVFFVGGDESANIEDFLYFIEKLNQKCRFLMRQE